jgi:non-homologous end joining protein Ku
MATRTTNVNLNYGTFNLQVAVEGIVREQSKEIAFRNEHKADGGAIGHKNYCKKCNALVENSEIEKVYEIGGQKAVFNKDDLQDMQVSSGISIRGYGTKLIPDYQIKKCYLLGIGTDKKQERFNRLNYAILKRKLKTSGGYLTTESKLNNRGVKGGSIGVIRYDEQTNKLMLVELYYSEEIVGLNNKMTDAVLNEEVLDKVVAKTFGTLTEIEVANITEVQSKKFFDTIERKLNLNSLEEKAQVEAPKMSEEERLLMTML